MCGICGVVNFDKTNASEHLLSLMIRAMKHRGPDDEGLFIEEDIGLGFVRLSILDLSKEGHQPMVSNDNNYVLVFNGEIYNYLEIRQELIVKGYSFRSETDSEVLLNAYIEWGYDFLNRLNGMFAFAIFNRKSKELFCARDRFGIKPFYYKKTKEQFLFASDIPSILTSSNIHIQNDKMIYDYLLFNRINHTNETFFEDIFKLPHGHFLIIKFIN
jgi:asparagine synthase (glutamine-hydrolysing)